jgi:hypothetical protein
VVPAAIEFIDIAGLVKGAHEGAGLGNQFLGHIREVDAVLHLVRAFHNPNVQHSEGAPDPERDVRIVEEELKLAQIEKPEIYVVNVDESYLGAASRSDFRGVISTSDGSSKVQTQPESRGFDAAENRWSASTAPLIISAKLESELSELSPTERKEYLKELGVESSGLDKVIRLCYDLLELITFFTVAHGKQVQAWPIKKGTMAQEAAGIVHTDMQKGFIKAEAIPWNKLVEARSWKEAAEKGWIRLEGKDYVLADGDVIEFKFNV